MELRPYYSASIVFPRTGGGTWPGEDLPMTKRSPSSLQASLSDPDPVLQSQRQEMAPYQKILLADLIETPTSFEVHCDLPGCNPADLDVSILNNRLYIKAERRHVHAKDFNTVHHMETSFG